jgi:hypothetical protein
MKRLLENKRGIAPLTSMLIIIVFGITMASLSYVSSMALVGDFRVDSGEQINDQIVLDTYTWNSTSGQLQLFLHNVGRSEVLVDRIYILANNGIQIFDGPTASSSGTGNLAILKTEAFTCGAAVSDLTLGSSYTIKVFIDSGNTISYSAEFGRSA